jgi:hypothetical protein
MKKGAFSLKEIDGVLQPNHSFGHNRTLRGRWSPRREVHLALSLFPDQVLNRRIPTPPQCQIDPLQHDVVDFEALLEGDLA